MNRPTGPLPEGNGRQPLISSASPASQGGDETVAKLARSMRMVMPPVRPQAVGCHIAARGLAHGWRVTRPVRRTLICWKVSSAWGPGSPPRPGPHDLWRRQVVVRPDAARAPG